MTKKSVYVVLACIVLIPFVSFASPVIRSGEAVTVGSDQVVNGDFYGFSDSVTLSGRIDGDAYVVGRKITINAPVVADVALVGSDIQLHAPIGDDFRAVGAEVTLADTVEGDVFVFGGTLRVLSTASVSGDVIFYGGQLIIEGPVEGAVFSTGQTARIDAFVGGDVHVVAERMTLGDRAEVLGDVIYRGDTDIVRSQNAVVVGDVQEEMQAQESVSFGSIIIPLIMSIFTSLIAFLLFRSFFRHAATDIKDEYGKHGLIGLAVFVALPFAALILTISILGLFVGIFLFALYVLLIIAAWVTATIATGTYVMKLIMKREEVTLVSILVGVAVLDVVLLIPLIGPLAVFALMLIALGMLSSRLYQHLFAQ